ncbi:snRNA-activating protein complex subunit 5 isoform 2-T2 [Vipera latastei]
MTQEPVVQVTSRTREDAGTQTGSTPVLPSFDSDNEGENNLMVEELALRSMINTREGAMFTPSAAVMEEHVNMDNEVAINQTKLQLQVHADEEEEEEEESDS